jgi:transposase InsO family protein
LCTELVLDVVGMAITTPEPPTGTVHHTHRGTQYTSYEFGTALRASGLLASMGRVGSAFDNAIAESVVATLKTELIYPPDLANPPRAGDRGLLLPRRLLQHPPPALPARQPQPQRLRTMHLT